jgi:hypothetical protein
MILMQERGIGFFWILIFAGTFFSCTPQAPPPPVNASVVHVQILLIDTGGPGLRREMVPVLAVHLHFVNPGAEVRLLGYRYETSRGIISEALADKALMEKSRTRLGRLVQFGLPTVFPAGASTDGWVFFRTSNTKGKIHLSLRDVYGRFYAVYLPLPADNGQGKKKFPDPSSPSAPGLP